MHQEYLIRRLALILAIQAELEGMREWNIRLDNDNPKRYSQQDFDNKAEELRNLAYSHNEQLFS